MGLREIHATQTRELILNSAFTLFLDRGYDGTTMEEIASSSGIGTSTLYRYYPSKDLLVVGPLQLHGQMARELRARPSDEPLSLALGHALQVLMYTPRADAARMKQIRQVLEATPALGVRIYAEFARERGELEVAVADRLGRPTGDLFCRATARMTATILELLGDVGNQRLDGPNGGVTQIVDVHSVLAQLNAEPPVLPRLES